MDFKDQTDILKKHHTALFCYRCVMSGWKTIEQKNIKMIKIGVDWNHLYVCNIVHVLFASFHLLLLLLHVTKQFAYKNWKCMKKNNSLAFLVNITYQVLRLGGLSEHVSACT